MKNALFFNELRDLKNSSPSLDRFGPGAEYEYLFIDILQSDDLINSWMQSLPCPVIGVGKGAAQGGCDVVLPNTDKMEVIAKNISAAPLAAMALVQHLRAIEHMPMNMALTVESFSYATLQQGPEFKAWLAYYDGSASIDEPGPPLITEIDGDRLSIRLNRPKNYNAIDTEMRDALCEVLDMTITHDGFKTIELTGNGKAFSIGGALQEFGQVTDPATAHWIRSLRLPATRLLKLREKLHVHVNGAAIGAGIEMAAFAGNVTCSPKAWFQLPELKYGLIPGAGGTVSVMSRIGRQRTAYMALSMEKISPKTAVEWGLVDRVV